MNTKNYIFIVITLLTLNYSFGQNLKPDLANTITVNIPPVVTDYIGLTKIYLQPNYNEDQRYRSYLASRINTNNYSIENTLETAELFFTYDIQRTWKKNTVASATNNTSTDKAGNKITTTTYKYDGTEEIRLILRLYLANGVMLQEASDRTQVSYTGTSTDTFTGM